jgi:hypothetical protein
MRNTPLLALGALAMFGYVTSAVLQYFRQSLGVPAALAIAGVLILGLAVVSTRLMRAARPPSPTSRTRESHQTETFPRPRRRPPSAGR